ncbi:uncharacterized protein LOC141585555 [Saimiri boliviensis]|uniref:uncharacterized protein LOC141585555 n=1 Tax=Saimiri boliviensis TaxID=27679 RepID=UPI003D778D45
MCSPGLCRLQVWRSRRAGREGKTAPDLPEVSSSMQRELCPHQRWPSVLTSAAFNSRPARGGRKWGRGTGGGGGGARAAARLTRLPVRCPANVRVFAFSAICFLQRGSGGASPSTLAGSIYGQATWVAIFMSDFFMLPKQRRGLAAVVAVVSRGARLAHVILKSHDSQMLRMVASQDEWSWVLETLLGGNTAKMPHESDWTVIYRNPNTFEWNQPSPGDNED